MADLDLALERLRTWTIHDDGYTVGNPYDLYGSGDPRSDVAVLLVEVEGLRSWQAGVLGAATIARAPRTGDHTEAAYVAHRTAYESGPEAYRQGADVVAEVDLRRRDAEHERDDWRAGSGVEARAADEARAEVTRLRSSLAAARREPGEWLRREAQTSLRDDAAMADYLARRWDAEHLEEDRR